VTLPPDHFGPGVAEHYDSDDEGPFARETIARTVAVLTELAAGRPALELAIGTGRIGLPLAQAGVEVHGIELSEAMVAQLRAKDGGDAIPVAIGDMAHLRVPGEFGLAYLVFNTIGNLTTQDEQIACFQNAAAHLVAGGLFVIEVGIPPLRRIAPGDRFHVFDHSSEHVGIDEIDPVDQVLVSHHWSPQNGWASVPFRYVWPAELDLMARLAGMRLRHRWTDWDRAPFTADSEKHLSVWERVA
jgi:hypothetical protein